MTKQLNGFFKKCNDICNKFNVTDDVAGCFLVNYGDKSDICRDCFRKTECCKMNESKICKEMKKDERRRIS